MQSRLAILFLCTGNSCRSQMAEAILRHLAPDQFEALSAGTQPAGYVHPLATDTLERRGISFEGQRSKGWDEFAGQPVDLVITVCDAAASTPCPSWTDGTMMVHWSLPDPANHLGTDTERRELAERVADRLEAKIRGLIELDWTMDVGELRQRLTFLGEI